GQRVLETRLERRALTEVHGVAHHLGPGGAREVPRAVGRAVVDAHDVRERAPHVPDYLTDDSRLVEERDDHPGIRVGRGVPLAGGSRSHGAIVAPWTCVPRGEP